MPRVYRLKNGQISQRRQMIEFIRDNPNCTLHDVMRRLGICAAQASMSLSRLKRDGVLEAHKEEGERLQTWMVVDETDDGVDHSPFRHVVKREWTGHARDALLTAFFGAP